MSLLDDAEFNCDEIEESPLEKENVIQYTFHDIQEEYCKEYGDVLKLDGKVIRNHLRILWNIAYSEGTKFGKKEE